VQSRILI